MAEFKEFDDIKELEFYFLEEIKLGNVSKEFCELYNTSSYIFPKFFYVAHKIKEHFILINEYGKYGILNNELNIGDIGFVLDGKFIPTNISSKDVQDFLSWYDDSKNFKGWQEVLEENADEYKELNIDILKEVCLITKERNIKKQKEVEKERAELANKDFQSWEKENKLINDKYQVEGKLIKTEHITFELEKDVSELDWDYYVLERYLKSLANLGTANYEYYNYDYVCDIINELTKINKEVKVEVTFYSLGDVEISIEGSKTFLSTPNFKKARVRKTKLVQTLRYLQRKKGSLTKEEVEQYTKLSEILIKVLDMDKIIVSKDRYAWYNNDVKDGDIPLNINLEVNDKEMDLTILGITKKLKWNILKPFFCSGSYVNSKIGYEKFCKLMKLMEIPKKDYLDKLKTERVFGLLK